MNQNLNQNLTIPNQSTIMQETKYSQFMKRHRNRNNRRLHFLGWMISFLVIVQAIFTFQFSNILYVIPIVLAFNFCGHYFCEGDHMACGDPLGSLVNQFQMCKQIVMQKMEF